MTPLECVKECFIHVLVLLLLIFTVCRFCVLWTGEGVKWFWKSIVLLIRKGPVECFLTVGAITGGVTFALAAILAFLSNWYDVVEAREASIDFFLMCGGVFTAGVILIAVLQHLDNCLTRLRTKSCGELLCRLVAIAVEATLIALAMHLPDQDCRLIFIFFAFALFFPLAIAAFGARGRKVVP